MKNQKRANIGVVTWPILEAGVAPLQQLVEILYPFSNELHVITGGAAHDISIEAKLELHLHLIEQKSTANSFMRVMNNVSTQFKISWRLCRIAGHVDLLIFFFGGPVLLLPILTTKFLRKDIVLVLTGDAPAELRHQMGRLIFEVVKFLTKINFSLSERIVVYSERLIKVWGLEKYGHKVYTARRHFLDFNKFKMRKTLNERASLIGYIGRLNEGKGILNFIEAIPKVMETIDEATFLIGGDGQLSSQIEGYANKSNEKVKYVGWIPHDKLPHYLNELKLLVVPSYREAGPNIAFEAMACGTPVLATPVGSIPDVIKDGETGFTMENNSPECIAKNVIRALNHPNLEQITGNAHRLVEKEFTYEAAVERYRNILNSLPPYIEQQ